MTGYFSQLARHTGLGFEPGATMTAGSAAAELPVAVQPPQSAPPAPPHIEEIVFTAPAPGAVEGSSEGLVSSVGADGDDHPRSAAATAKRWIDVSPDPESGTGNPRGRSAEEQSPAGEPRVVQLDEWATAERQPGPQEPIEITRESIEMVESRPEVKDPDPPQPTRVREPADAVRDEHLEREVIVHSYLEEVRAWVAAPPEPDQRELGQRELEQRRVAQRPPAGRSDVFALEPEAEATVPRSGRPEALEVQNLNLSIGTISIVIEEPKQTAPAALPAPPRADRPPERLASEPTRLSRYYLTRW